MKQFTVRLDIELAVNLKQYAKDNYLSMNQVVAKSLRELLKKDLEKQCI